MKKTNIQERQKELEKELLEDSKLDVKKLFEKYKTSYEGISIVDIEEKQDITRCYNTKANSFQSFFESFRNINIITSLIHSMTYKRRNMTENELLLINEVRKKILNEINLILQDISSLFR